MAAANNYLDSYPSTAATLCGQDLPWLQQVRAAALTRFSASGFPSPREEEWRYTNVSAIEKKLFAPSALANKPSLDPALIEHFRLAECWSVVLVNGRFDASLSSLDGLPDGVVVTSMATALTANPDLVAEHFAKAVNSEEHGFIAFNTAWFNDGVFIYMPPKQVVDRPIQILHYVNQSDIAAVTRQLVVVGECAEVSVIETYAGEGNAYLSATVNEAVIGENAALTWYKFQCEADKAYHFGGTYVNQADNARFTQHNFAFGGLLARSDIHCNLNKAAECELNGLYLGSNRQHLDNHTRINHLKPCGISREMYKGVLDDRARGVFQGRVIVAEDAQKTDSLMNNRNLLLSNDAEADTKPQLEIYADDVKCGHGVTVGQLDEKSVFYLQSRCVDEETARNMLTFAFANEMVDKVKVKSLHDKVLEQVLLRFPQEGVEKEWL
jgi:Fe-S cluster assembly protein SufD